MLIPLTQGKFAFIDEEDKDLARFNWYVSQEGTESNPLFYARRHITLHHKQITIKLHRIILERMLGRELEPGEEVDHRNGDSLDNGRANLRLATKSENRRNQRRNNNQKSSKYKGVSKHRNKWRAMIWLNGHQKHVGNFADETDAAKAYDEAARHYFGEFAKTNL
jgi:hypothetical protein